MLNTLPSEVEGSCGEDLQLWCSADGQPNPEVVWVQPGAEEETLEPLTAGRGVKLGGGGDLLIVEEEGLPELGLTFVCLAKNRRGEARQRVLVKWEQNCNATATEDLEDELDGVEEVAEVEAGVVEVEEVVELTAGERGAVTLNCPDPQPGPALVQWVRGGQEPVISWYMGFSQEMPRSCGALFGLFTPSLGISAASQSCKVKQVAASKLSKLKVGAASVRLNWLTRRDEGRYTCKVWSLQGNGSLVASATLDLTVRGKPVIEEHSAEETHAVLGQPLTLTCRTSARPKPTVTWFREDSPIYSPHPLFQVIETEVEVGDEIGSLDGGEVVSKLHVTEATQVSHQVVLCHLTLLSDRLVE